jgi:WD40 repeat protein
VTPSCWGGSSSAATPTPSRPWCGGTAAWSWACAGASSSTAARPRTPSRPPSWSWPARRPRCATPPPWPPSCTASPDAKPDDPAVNWLGPHQWLALYDTATGRLLRKIGPGYDLEPAAFSADGKTIYLSEAARPGGDFRFASLPSVGSAGLAVLGRYFLPRNRPSASDKKFLNLDGRLSPDGKLLVVLGAVEQGRDSVLHLFDTATGKKRGEIKGHEAKATVLAPKTGDPETITRSGVLCFAFGPDGSTLITGGEDGTVRVWGVADAREIARDASHLDGRQGPAAVLSVAVSPDGRLASIDDKGSLHIRDVPR